MNLKFIQNSSFSFKPFCFKPFGFNAFGFNSFSFNAFSFITMFAVAQTTHAAMLPDNPSVVHSKTLLDNILLEQRFLEVPFVVQKSSIAPQDNGMPSESNGVTSLLSSESARQNSRLPASLNDHPVKRRSESPISRLVESHRAKILVVDAQALNFGQLVPIPTAQAKWMGLESRAQSLASANGVINSPYPQTRSQRFIVEAEGYIPAIGYVVMGSVAIAPMYKSSLIQPLIESLDISDLRSHIVIGKALDSKLNPIPHLKVDLSDTNSRIDYALGSWGIFMQGLTESGSTGDFVVSGLSGSLQYFMPVDQENNEEWPSTVVDLSGAPQIVSIAIPKAEKEFSKTTILDAFALEKPEGMINLTIGGQRGVYIPEADGSTIIENLFVRPSVDVFEIRAPEYSKSWVHAPANPLMVPEFAPLLSEFQVQQILEPLNLNWNASQSLVVGTLKEFTNKDLRLHVIGPDGKKAQHATVIYFDKENNANPNVDSLSENSRFMVLDLEDGEWTIMTSDHTNSQKAFGLGVSIVRVNSGVISFVEI